MQIIGVLDWELVIFGDLLMDFGNIFVYWVEVGDLVLVQLICCQFSYLLGMLICWEFVDYYVEWVGILLIDNLDFYYIYGLFCFVGIVQQIYYCYYYGQIQDKCFVQFVQMNKLLEQMSLQVIECFCL